MAQRDGAIRHLRDCAPPPFRDKREGLARVATASDQRHAVEYQVVEFDLIGKALQRVAVALQFVARHLTVNDGHVDTR